MKACALQEMVTSVANADTPKRRVESECNKVVVQQQTKRVKRRDRYGVLQAHATE